MTAPTDPTAAPVPTLLTKQEAAALLSKSTRYIDRQRAAGYDLGEVRLTPTATPRFRRAVLEQAIRDGKFMKKFTKK